MDYFFCEECETYHQPNRIINGEMLSACEREIPYSAETSKNPSTISKRISSKPIQITNSIYRPSTFMNTSTRQSPNRVTFSYKSPQQNSLQSTNTIYTNRERISNYPFRNLGDNNSRQSMSRNSMERKDILSSGSGNKYDRGNIVERVLVRNMSPSPIKSNRFSSAFISPYQLNRQHPNAQQISPYLNRQYQNVQQVSSIAPIQEINNSENISSLSSPITSVNRLKTNHLIPEQENYQTSHQEPITLSQIPDASNFEKETNTTSSNHNPYFKEQEFWLERANADEKEFIEEGEEENQICGALF